MAGIWFRVDCDIFCQADKSVRGVLLVCCRGISPTVREGSVVIRAGALPDGRASAPLVP